MTKFERTTLIIAALALVTSIVALSKDEIKAFMGGDRVDLAVENRIELKSNLGSLVLTPFIRVVNLGGSALRLSRIDAEITLESGKVIKLTSPTIQSEPQAYGAPLPLSGKEILVNSALSGRLILGEDLTRVEEEALRTLQHEALTSSYKRYLAFNSKISKMAQSWASLMANPKAKFPEDRIAAIADGIVRADYFEPEAQYTIKAKEIFDSRISKIERGEHTIRFKVFSFEGKLLFEKKYKFTIFENQLAELRKLFDGFGFYYTSNAGFTPQLLPAVVLKEPTQDTEKK